jgi:para-aminobenzoate synthetase/4-amino-4-deoxychorismate lyase
MLSILRSAAFPMRGEKHCGQIDLTISAFYCLRTQDKIDCTGMSARTRWGRLDDFSSGETTAFPHFDAQIVAQQPDEVVHAIRAVEQATAQGRWAFGFVSYEAAAGLDPHLARICQPVPRTDPAALPLVWFGVGDPPVCTNGVVATAARYHVGGWSDRWNRGQYQQAFERVRAAIAAGDTYQCNLTTAVSASFSGDTQAFYLDLARAQAARYSAYVDIDDHVIASASPELFFEWSGSTLRTRPMKGTAPRGRTAAEDRSLLAHLRSSPKERAENLIIVDLLRNDLGKIATMGSVHVPALLTPERYPTVWQLTSEITAELRPEIGLVEIFEALFPCGSVTGAPKLATMALIRETEQRDRGIYCGAIGWVAPPGEETRARFSVAIRTAHIDRSRAHCEYGVGGGITWSSTAAAEYAEIHAKRQILDHCRVDHAGAGVGQA